MDCSGPWGERITRDKVREWQASMKIGISYYPKDIHVSAEYMGTDDGRCSFEREHVAGGYFTA